MSALRRTSYTFREGLTMMAAKALGIDPDLAVEAGENATAVMNLIRRAANARGHDLDRILRDAQRELGRISPRRHGELVAVLRSKIEAIGGKQPSSTSRASVNPATGAEEFFWPFDKVKDWFKKEPEIEPIPIIGVPRNETLRGKFNGLNRVTPNHALAGMVEEYGQIPTASDRKSYIDRFFKRLELPAADVHLLRQGVVPNAEKYARTASDEGQGGMQRDYERFGGFNDALYFEGNDGKLYRRNPDVRDDGESALGRTIRFFDNERSKADTTDEKFRRKSIKPKRGMERYPTF